MEKRIRNFSIIAHIDHGKSTLADRLLELTHTIEKAKLRPQFLDSMDLEYEKGITIKMHPVRMDYTDESGKQYILNLIDTPGHVDFSYEVSRSLAAVEGAILLIDAATGVQAQTLANLELAQKENLKIIPVINKIDMPQARIEEAVSEIKEILPVEEKDILKISAKTGQNIDLIVKEVIKQIPPPEKQESEILKALIFDSKYDSFLGVIAYVRIFQGELKMQDNLFLIRQNMKVKAKEVGWFSPQLIAKQKLEDGEIGYVALGIKDPSLVRIGETITNYNPDKKVEPLPGYREAQQAVFTSIFPRDANDWPALRDSLMRLKLNDSSLSFEPESKSVLGKGFRCGFLGLLHAEITTERLRREFNLDLIISSPSVSYKIIGKNGKEEIIYSSKDWPHYSEIQEIYEQYVELKIITPTSFLNQILKMIAGRESTTNVLSPERLIIQAKMPLREIIIGFYDTLKSVSQGYASMDYRIIGWKKSDLVKLEILILGKTEETISKIVPRNISMQEAKKIAEKLEKVLPSQLFELPIQIQCEGRVICRRTIRAKRKDVTAPLYGGDYTRKRKLLEKQKKGKKKLKERGQVSIPPEVFWDIIKTD
ncbi:MAG: translation elongation factor 4 [Candidatus Pacebacteria bacterium]|nr:translation elongation factor 4 [Candidatus Paceibacterota bacterium]MDD5621008.1 translation elongation factor 4 [Candidatus Paceibacterota bacterium]